ncbi:MAG TPA: hypothetical protein VI451_17995, partial [Anaerolineales bacterium]|nr:hypothetical protein [Anaerolineales bacterium]
MNLEEFLLKNVGRFPPRVVAWIEKRLKTIPAIRQKIDQEYDEMMAGLEGSLKPYRGQFPSFTEIPETGRDRADILREMEAMQAQEEANWRNGFVSGAVYHGDQGHIEFLNKV